MSRDHIADQEDAGTRACQAAANAAGKTTTQADNCNDGEHQCPTCPWQKAPATDATRSPFLTRDVAELLGVSVPELSAALQRLGYAPHSQGMAICPHEALAVARANKSPNQPAESHDAALLTRALEVLERYSRWAADIGTELEAANTISALKLRLGVP